MSTKRYKPEQVVNILRQIEVEIANGKTTPHRLVQRKNRFLREPEGAVEFEGAGAPVTASVLIFGNFRLAG